MDTSPSVEGPNSVGGGNVWFKRVPTVSARRSGSTAANTHGAYSVIESVGRAGLRCPRRTVTATRKSTFLVISRSLPRIAIGDQILDAPPGTSRNCPPKTPRTAGGNIAAEEKSAAGDPHPRRIRADHLRGSRTLQPRRSETLAEGFGCDILGPPVAECSTGAWWLAHRTARQPANIPKPSIATPMETDCGRSTQSGRNIPLEAARR